MQVQVGYDPKIKNEKKSLLVILSRFQICPQVRTGSSIEDLGRLDTSSFHICFFVEFCWHTYVLATAYINSVITELIQYIKTRKFLRNFAKQHESS